MSVFLFGGIIRRNSLPKVLDPPFLATRRAAEFKVRTLDRSQRNIDTIETRIDNAKAKIQDKEGFEQDPKGKWRCRV